MPQRDGPCLLRKFVDVETIDFSGRRNASPRWGCSFSSARCCPSSRNVRISTILNEDLPSDRLRHAFRTQIRQTARGLLAGSHLISSDAHVEFPAIRALRKPSIDGSRLENAARREKLTLPSTSSPLNLPHCRCYVSAIRAIRVGERLGGVRLRRVTWFRNFGPN